MKSLVVRSVYIYIYILSPGIVGNMSRYCMIVCVRVFSQLAGKGKY